jgi:hypothetical protein
MSGKPSFYTLTPSDWLTFRRRFRLESDRSPSELAARLADHAAPPPTDNNPLTAAVSVAMTHAGDAVLFEVYVLRGLPTGGTFAGLYATGRLSQLDGESSTVVGEILPTRTGYTVYGGLLGALLLWVVTAYSASLATPYVTALTVYVALVTTGVFGLYIISLQWRDLRALTHVLREIAT